MFTLFLIRYKPFKIERFIKDKRLVNVWLKQTNLQNLQNLQNWQEHI